MSKTKQRINKFALEWVPRDLNPNLRKRKPMPHCTMHIQDFCEEKRLRVFLMDMGREIEIVVCEGCLVEALYKLFPETIKDFPLRAEGTNGD